MPNHAEFREFYLCGIRTGYDTYYYAERAAKAWKSHTVYDCEYCPGYHHVKADSLQSSEALLSYAEKHWDALQEELSKERALV